MTHDIPDETMRLIVEMDKKIGEFMKKRAEVVNRVIYEQAELHTGDFVRIYDGDDLVGTGSIVQPLFLKHRSLVTYRVLKEDGEMFTNENYRLEKVD